MTWEDFFDKYPKGAKKIKYINQIKQIADTYPDNPALYVDFNDIEDYDDVMTVWLESNPDKALKKGVLAMRDVITGVLGERDDSKNGVDKWKIYIRIDNCPRDLKVPIRDIRDKHLLKFITVEGIASRAQIVRPDTKVAAFECVRCGHNTMVFQETHKLEYPMSCVKEDGGCGRAAGSTKWKYNLEHSEKYSSQKIEVQERPEGLRGGAQPQTVVARVFDDLCGVISPGDKVMISGILRGVPGEKTTAIEHYLEGNHITLIDVEAEEIEIEETEKTEIIRLSRLPAIQEMIAGSVAPAIFGHDVIKLALALQMFGGVTKQQGDIRIRGESHILLVGDPGTAKSQMLISVAGIAPRSVFTSGKGATAAGLTACATHDEFGEGKWTIEAGAMVLADGGCCIVDELDKMSNQDRSALHEALEHGVVTVHKASIHTTLSARCSMLAAANPKLGRFDPMELLANQINLPAPLLSRFDLIFPITDVPEKELDRKIADHILKSHLAGTVQRRSDAGLETLDDDGRIAESQKAVMPVIPRDLLRKYVYLAKRVLPVMTTESMDALLEYYLSIRKTGEAEGSAVPITARQLEGLIRLSESSARIRLSDVVSLDDVTCAKMVFDEFLNRVVCRGGQSFDIDAISGTPKSLRDNIHVCQKIIDRLDKDHGKFSFEDFVLAAQEAGVLEQKATSIFSSILHDGDIFGTSQSGYKKARTGWIL